MSLPTATDKHGIVWAWAGETWRSDDGREMYTEQLRDQRGPCHATPQIVRTIADLEALDPDTLVAISAEHGDCDQPRLAGWVRTFFPLSESGPVFPAVVVASGEHVRACRAALEGETK